MCSHTRARLGVQGGVHAGGLCKGGVCLVRACKMGGGDAACTERRGWRCARCMWTRMCTRVRVCSQGPAEAVGALLSSPFHRHGGGTHHRTRLRGGWHTGTPSVPAFTNPSSYSGPRRRPRRAPSRWARGFCRPAGRGLSYQCLSQKAALRRGRAGEKERGASGWASWPGQAGAGRLGRAGVPRQRCGGPPCRAVAPCPGSAVPVPK